MQAHTSSLLSSSPFSVPGSTWTCMCCRGYVRVYVLPRLLKTIHMKRSYVNIQLSFMLNKNTLGVKKVRGQSEATMVI